MIYRKHKPKFCLDSPDHRHLQDEMIFSGWYFPEPKTDPVLVVRVDGQDRTQLQHGLSRADVAAVFPTVKMAGQSGFWGSFRLDHTPKSADIEILDVANQQDPVSLFKETFTPVPSRLSTRVGKHDCPIPPRDLLARISGDPDPINFQNSLDSLRHLVTSYLAEAGLKFSQFEDILDLGCGVGRFLMAVRDTLRPGQKLWGCDVHRGCADWCRKHIDFAEVVHNNEEPPLPYPERQFDLVYALSVFTHLKLDLQFRWAWEIFRALKPGGIAFLTLHGNAFFPTFYRSWRDGLTVAGETISIGDAGLFAYLAMKSGDNDQGQIGIAAGHSPAFAQELFAPFQVLKWVPQSLLAGGQDLYILQKPGHGSRLALAEPEVHSWWKPKETVNLNKGGQGVKLRFYLDGQTHFRVYPNIDLTGSCTVELDIEIMCEITGKSLISARVPMNQNTLFGKDHFGMATIPIPQHRGFVSVKLCSKIEHSYITSSEKGVMVWGFPHFLTLPTHT